MMRHRQRLGVLGLVVGVALLHAWANAGATGGCDGGCISPYGDLTRPNAVLLAPAPSVSSS